MTFTLEDVRTIWKNATRFEIGSGSFIVIYSGDDAIGHVGYEYMEGRDDIVIFRRSLNYVHDINVLFRNTKITCNYVLSYSRHDYVSMYTRDNITFISCEDGDLAHKHMLSDIIERDILNNQSRKKSARQY